jgi:hypothetical protein
MDQKLNKKILLPSKKFFKAVDDEQSINLDLSNEYNLIREGERNIVLDLNELYDEERNESNKYKIYGKMKMIFSNGYSGTTNYDHLKNTLYLNGDGSNNVWEGNLPYNEFAFVRNDFIRVSENNIIGENSHLPINILENKFFNWGLYLSYCFDKDSNFNFNYTYNLNKDITFKSGDGIPFIVEDFIQYYKLTSPVNHNIKKNEFILISEKYIDVDKNERCVLINEVGDETYKSDEKVLIIYKSQMNYRLPNVLIGKRCLNNLDIDNTLSEYYVQKLKILTEEKDYNIDNLEIESPIWANEKKILYKNFSNKENVIVEKNRMESVLFDFKKPFVLSNLKNNLGVTPNEIYLTIINKNKNGYFNYPPNIGYSFNFHDNWVDNTFPTSHETNLTSTQINRNGISFKVGNNINKDTIINGNFTEYNQFELKEYIISNSHHKLTIPKSIFDYNQDNNQNFSGVTIDNTFGLFYQNNYKIKLREESPYIEYSNTNDVFNLPENSKYSNSEKKWKWRDLYQHGFIDQEGNGTNYPFLNGSHHIKLDINFYLKNEVNYKNKQNSVKNFNDFKIDC